MNRVLESWGPLVLAGPLTRLWSMQSVRGREPSAIVKMGIGCLLVAGAFLFMLGMNARRWKMARDMPPGARVCVAMTGRTILCSVERDRRLQRIGAMRPRCTQVQRILVGFLQSAFTDCLVCQCRSGAWHACPNRTGRLPATNRAFRSIAALRRHDAYYRRTLSLTRRALIRHAGPVMSGVVAKNRRKE